MMYLILLAAGKSVRFGGNKLLTEFQGKKLYKYPLEVLYELKDKNPAECRVLVVTSYLEIEEACAGKDGVFAIHNDDQDAGISHSIHLALNQAEQLSKDNGLNIESDAFLFCVADQPWIDVSVLEDFLQAFQKSKKAMGCMQYEDRLGNPCIFSDSCINDLKSLTGDVGGKKLIKRHPERTFFYEVDRKQMFWDIDTRNDMKIEQE